MYHDEKDLPMCGLMTKVGTAIDIYILEHFIET